MDRETAWRDVARIVKNRIDVGCMVATWYASIMTAGVLMQDSTADYLAANQWAATVVTILWLVGGFLMGRLATWAVFRGLPDPETSA